jgi:hypothetical protein
MYKVRAAFACLFALPSLAVAAQWKVIPQLALRADTDTNRRLLLQPRQSESAVLDAALPIARSTEVSTLSLTPRVKVGRYSGDDTLDSEDLSATALYRRDGERHGFEFSGGFADDSTLVTELGETGLVEGNTRRRSIQASASLTKYLGTRHLLQYGLGASDVDYTHAAGTGLVGYRYPSASLLYVMSVTPRLDTTFLINGARLDVPDSQLVSNTRGAQFGFRFRISERLDLEARTGASSTRARGRSDSKQSFFSSLSWNDEISRLELSLSRGVEPNGRGILVNADDLRLAYSRDLTERLKLDTSVRASLREDVLFDLRSNEYRYGAATLALWWRLDQNWTAGLTGIYSHQEYELAIGGAEGRRIGFSLAWMPLQ